MPHCIIEYADELKHYIAPDSLLTCVHQAVLASDLFDVSHIKTRAINYRHYQLDDNNLSFIHITIRLHQGRSIAQRQALSASVLKATEQLGLRDTTITVEIIEMDTACYAKSSS